MDSSPLLEVQHLSISYQLPLENVRAVRDVSLLISQSETLALVGETGSGKSTLALAVLGLLDNRICMESGRILLEGRNIQSLQECDWRNIRSQKIGMIFQDARSALNPVLTVMDHLVETLLAHQRLSKKNARERAREILYEVGIPKSQERLFPFELSGGMCQRVGIALGICNNPRLLIADEPTSAVDSTLQAQILDLLQLMKERYGLSLLLISHDLLLISQVADRISVMYHGRIIESGVKEDVLTSPAHPYTQGLIQCQPDISHRHDTHPLTAVPGPAPTHGEDFPGCAFAPRCRDAEPRCKESVPQEHAVSDDHRAACVKANKVRD